MKKEELENASNESKTYDCIENNEESILISNVELENKELERETGFLENTKESKSNTSSISNISETSYLELEHETPEQES